jgi:hypothetical protein
VRGLEEPLPLLSPRSVRRVIDDAHHENMKDALRALNARLVELDDRVLDAEDARESLTGAWRSYNLSPASSARRWSGRSMRTT